MRGLWYVQITILDYGSSTKVRSGTDYGKASLAQDCAASASQKECFLTDLRIGLQKGVTDLEGGGFVFGGVGLCLDDGGGEGFGDV